MEIIVNFQRPMKRVSVCLGCRSPDLRLDNKSGDVICEECGQISCGRFIDEGDEVKIYLDDHDPNKVSRTSGFSETFSSLQTSFVTSCEDTRRTLERAQRYSTDPNELKVMANIGNIGEMCSKLNLTQSVKDKTIKLFTEAIVSQAAPLQKNKEMIIAACISITCRVVGYPRTVDEISAVTGLCAKSIAKIQRILIQKMELSVPRLRPEQLVNRMVSRLLLKNGYALSLLAGELCQCMARYELLEHVSPQVVAVLSIILAGVLQRHRQTDVSSTETSTSTSTSTSTTISSGGVVDADHQHLSRIDVAQLCQIAWIQVSALRMAYRSLYPSLSVVIMQAAATSSSSSSSSSSSPFRGDGPSRLSMMNNFAFPDVLDKLLEDGHLLVFSTSTVDSSLQLQAPRSSSSSRHSPDSEIVQNKHIRELVQNVNATNTSMTPAASAVVAPPSSSSSTAAAAVAVAPSSRQRSFSSDGEALLALVDDIVSIGAGRSDGRSEGEGEGEGGGRSTGRLLAPSSSSSSSSSSSFAESSSTHLSPPASASAVTKRSRRTGSDLFNCNDATISDISTSHVVDTGTTNTMESVSPPESCSSSSSFHLKRRKLG